MYSVLERLPVNAITVQNFEALASNTCSSHDSISLTHTHVIARHKLNAGSANAITSASSIRLFYSKAHQQTSNSSFGSRAKNL